MKIKNLFPDQASALSDLHSAIGAHQHVLFSAPTGAGKTVMAAHLLESASDPSGTFHSQIKQALNKDPHSPLKTAFVVDRTVLIAQTIEQFQDAGLDFGVIQADHPLAAPEKPLQICSIQTLTRRNNRTDLGSVLNDFDLTVIDECFVAGTPVSTPTGSISIEQVKPGDKVLNAIGVGTVEAVSQKESLNLYRLEFTDGTVTECTGNHPFFTAQGWVTAEKLDIGTPLIGIEDLSYLQQVLSTAKMGRQARTNSLYVRDHVEQASLLLDVLRQEIQKPNERRKRLQKNDSHSTRNSAYTHTKGRKRQITAFGTTGNATCTRWGLGSRTPYSNQTGATQRVPNLLQSRYSKSRFNDSNRNRWQFPQAAQPKKTRSEERGLTFSVRVASISRIQRESATPVFNLQVSGHPSYFANGVLVHNCHVVYSEMRKLAALNREQKSTIIVGLTATPFSSELNTLYDGKVSATTTHDLISAGRLVPPHFYRGSVIDMKGVKIKKGEWDTLQSTGKVLDVVANVVDDYLRRGERQKFICSAVSMTHVAALVDAFSLAGITAAPYTYEVGTAERKAIVEEFSKPNGVTQIQGIITVSAATKGFDVPDVGCIIDARPLRKALADYVQLLGRGLRSHKGSNKQRCIVLDHSGNYQRFGSLVEVFYHTGELMVLGKSETRALEIVTCLECDYSQPRFVFKPKAAERVSIQMNDKTLGQVNRRTQGAHMEMVPLYDCKNCGVRHHWAPPKKAIMDAHSGNRKLLPDREDLMQGVNKPIIPIGNPNMVAAFRAKIHNMSREKRQNWLLPQICYWLAEASRWQPVASSKPALSLKLHKRLNRLYHEYADEWLSFTTKPASISTRGLKTTTFLSSKKELYLNLHEAGIKAAGMDNKKYVNTLMAADVYSYYALNGVEMDAGLVYLLVNDENKYAQGLRNKPQTASTSTSTSTSTPTSVPTRRSASPSLGGSPIKAMATSAFAKN